MSAISAVLFPVRRDAAPTGRSARRTRTKRSRTDLAHRATGSRRGGSEGRRRRERSYCSHSRGQLFERFGAKRETPGSHRVARAAQAARSPMAGNGGRSILGKGVPFASRVTVVRSTRHSSECSYSLNLRGGRNPGMRGKRSLSRKRNPRVRIGAREAIPGSPHSAYSRNPRGGQRVRDPRGTPCRSRQSYVSIALPVIPRGRVETHRASTARVIAHSPGWDPGATCAQRYGRIRGASETPPGGARESLSDPAHVWSGGEP